MRQLLLRAYRVVNRHVVEGLQARGYTDLRATHTTLLSILPLSGGTVIDTAERAGSRLTLDSLEVVTDLEDSYEALIGSKTLQSILDGLQAFNEVAD